jgi:hypothetical protein
MAQTPPDYDPKKIAKSVSTGFKRMERFRKSRERLLKEYVGRWYGSNDTGGKATPINLIYQATTTLVPNLVYQDPKVSVSSNYLAYREYAHVLGLATNHLINEIQLRETLRMAVTDAIFLCGWVKTGISTSGETLDIDGVAHDIGQPYADRVDPDDMVIDPWARRIEEAIYVGNRYRIAKEVVQAIGLADDEQLNAMQSRLDQATEPDVTMLSQVGESKDAMKAGEPVEFVDLVDLWLPEENAIATIPWSPDGNLPGGDYLRVIDYDGPERGPYHMLGFAWVPDNIMPAPPAGVWHDLHETANRLARKAARQAERQKTVLAYEGSAQEDVADILETSDGEAVKVDNIEGVREINFGGVNEQNYDYLSWAKENFSEMSMNIDLLSGTGTNEPTATQAEIVQANSSVRLSDMQGLVYQFTADVTRDLAFFLHTDPLIELPLVKRTNGEDEQVVYSPEMREGDWMDYQLKIVPFSMARQDPNLKVRRLMEFTANGIPAMAQAFQMLGPVFKLEQAIELLGRNMGIEELEEIIDTAALRQRVERMQELIDQGIPVDPKVVQTIMNPDNQPDAVPLPGGGNPPAGAAPGGPPPGGIRPQQPNPMAGMGGNITPNMERNQRRQEVAGELQATYLR